MHNALYTLLVYFFPVHLHSQQGSDLECLKGLIAFGANTDCVNAFGQTPLDVAKMVFSGELPS